MAKGIALVTDHIGSGRMPRREGEPPLTIITRSDHRFCNLPEKMEA